MAQFLNTAAAYSEIENIINRAEKKVCPRFAPMSGCPAFYRKGFYTPARAAASMSPSLAGKNNLPPEE